MDIQTQQCSIGIFFAQPVELQVPFFQRNYVWEESDWEKFWETMCGVSATRGTHSYFMGTIVIKHGSSTRAMDNIKEIVDGQQRLITILLFFKAVCQKRKEEKIFNNLFVPYYKEKKLKVSLDDEKVFNKIIEDKTDEITEEDKKNKIYQCFEFFLKKDLQEIKNKNLTKIINNVCFVVIELGATQDEQQIFDTLNSIGFPLSTAEIVKNYLFKGRKKEDIENYQNYWKTLFEGEEREFWDRDVDTGRGKKHNIEVFFQAFFDLYNKETQSKKYGARGSLANRYKIFFQDKKVVRGSPSRIEFLDTIKEYTKIYHKNINHDLISGDIDFTSPLDRINIVVHKMNNTTILPYILYILKNVDDTKEKDAMLSLVESYIVRRALCRESTNSYNNFFPSLVHGIVRENIREFYTTSKNLNNLMYKLTMEENRHSLFPSDDRLWSKLSEAKEGIKNKNAKAVLYLVEQSLFDGKDTTRLFPLDSYSIEHILPKKWRDHWENFAENISNSHEQENYVNRYISKIGNLTILTQKLNSSISNERWEIKQNGREGKKNKGLIDYAQNIKIFNRKEWLYAKNWDANTIDSRTKYLYDIIKTIWATPEEPPQD